MSLWLSVIGAAIVVTAAALWVTRRGDDNRRGSTELDRDSLADDQLGL